LRRERFFDMRLSFPWIAYHGGQAVTFRERQYTMSNHYHAGIVDVQGRLPEFLEHFHKLFAKHQNALRGRWENFWASEQTSCVELVGDDDIVSKMVYTLTNPVKSHLVERAHHWPGATSLRHSLSGEPLVVTRPRVFFRDGGPMPASATLRFHRPPALRQMTQADYVTLIEGRIAAVEQTAAESRRRDGLSLLGRRHVLRQPWTERPHSREPRRGLNPRVASRSRWHRVEALLRNRPFLVAYRTPTMPGAPASRPSSRPAPTG
jgi:hypothetical protein